MEELRRLLDEDPGLIEAENPWSPLVCACEAGCLEAVRFLLDRGARMSRSSTDPEFNPLMAACATGRVHVVELLLAHGADPCRCGHRGRTALMFASYRDERPGDSDHMAVIRLLLKDGRVPVDARDSRGLTALQWACSFGRIERARVLLLEGLADHTVADVPGVTAKSLAQELGQEGCVQLLEVHEDKSPTQFSGPPP